LLVALHNRNFYVFTNNPSASKFPQFQWLQMAASRSLSQLDYQRLAEFRYHLRAFLKFSERAAAQTGLSPQQHQAMLAIKRGLYQSYKSSGTDLSQTELGPSQ
jgi:hypothetical protein